MKLLCKATGCVYDDYCQCARCGTDWYDGFVPQEACWLRYFYKVVWLWRRGQRWRKHPCETCKTPMFFTEEYCCSEKCYEDWIPF